MKLKSFFADSIEEAINLARREMGPDALLVNSKRSNIEARHLGAYEVVVCAAQTESGAPGVERESQTAHTALASAPVHRLSQDISAMRQQLERLAVSLGRAGGGMAGLASNPELSKAFATLTNAELDSELAYEVVGKLRFPLAPDALRTELKKLLSIDTDLGCPGAANRMVALVGPPGAGKTSSLVKLAVQYGISSRRPSQILSIDTYRIAASEELRSYPAILGIGCQVFETTTALAQALEEHRQKHLVLIDTPGLARGEVEIYDDLARFLATYPGIDTHLVLPASMRTVDLQRIADQYAIFKPRKLIFTRLDETQTFGPILSQSVRMGKPMSFVTRGQRIPEDLEPATPDLIVDLVLNSEPAREHSFGTAAA